MDVEMEIHALTAEKLAMQYVLIQALFRLSRLNSEVRSAIASAFDDAASVAESTATQLGGAAPPESAVKALRIVEELRAVVLGNEDEPKHAF